MLRRTILCFILVASTIVAALSQSTYNSHYEPHYSAPTDPRLSPSFGRGIYDFLFGPWPRRPNYETQRPIYNRPKPDFANDKVPDYDLYLLG